MIFCSQLSRCMQRLYNNPSHLQKNIPTFSPLSGTFLQQRSYVLFDKRFQYDQPTAMPATIWTSKTHWNQYRSPSARASWWDYRSKGVYFVTICTHKGLPFFGSIHSGKMQLSDMGRIALQCWKDIPQHSAATVSLDAFIIMPNHIHGIIVIEHPCKDKRPINPQHSAESAYFSQLSPLRGSLSAIVRSFKSAVTRLVRRQQQAMGLKLEDPFRWQDRFYDRILRNGQEYQAAVEHIHSNVQQWKKDDYYRPTPPPPPIEGPISTNQPKLPSTPQGPVKYYSCNKKRAKQPTKVTLLSRNTKQYHNSD